MEGENRRSVGKPISRRLQDEFKFLIEPLHRSVCLEVRNVNFIGQTRKRQC